MGEAADLVARPRAVRAARSVPEVDEVLVRQRDEALVEDGQASGAGIEDADGPSVHARILGAVPGSVRHVLELHSPNGAFAAIEDYLRAAGFFGGRAEDVVADLYLGYGLSTALRRGRHPDPPEPCPLPLAACRIRPELEPGLPAGAFRIGEWSRTWDEDAYAAAVEAVKAAIERGDVYQVNLVQHLSAPFEGDPECLAPALAPLDPLHPWPLSGDGWTIVSASPELFLARRGDRIWTKPIKGTRPLGAVRGPAGVGKGRCRARHDRRPRAQRPLPDLRAGLDPLARPDDRARARGCRAPRHDGRGPPPAGGRSRRAARGDLPGRLGHRRTEDLRPRPHRRVRARRPRRVDGRPRPSLAERRPRARAHDPHLRGRGRAYPPLGRRRNRLGLRSAGGDRGVVGEGAPAPRCHRRSASRSPRPRDAHRPRGRRARPRRPRRADPPRRRRGVPAQPRRLRDDARLRRPSRSSSTSTWRASRARRHGWRSAGSTRRS